jgi:hypothetical protein
VVNKYLANHATKCRVLWNHAYQVVMVGDLNFVDGDMRGKLHIFIFVYHRGGGMLKLEWGVSVSKLIDRRNSDRPAGAVSPVGGSRSEGMFC